jgi:phage protein D
MNWDAEARKFKYSDADTFNPGKEVELRIGYYRNGQDQLRRMLIGEITTLSPNFPESGAPTLTVRALNLFQRFRAKQITKAFSKKKDTEIAKLLVEEIAADINKTASGTKGVPRLQLEIDPKDVSDNLKHEKEIPYLIVNNQFPIRFLMERARRIGYELTLDEIPQGTDRKVTFHFRPTSAVNRPTYVLEWGKSLINFQPTLRTANQVSEVTVRGWNSSSKTKFEAKATRADLAAEGVVHPSALGVDEAALGQKEITVDRPIQTEAEAKDLAKKKLRQIAEVMVEAKGKTVGLPDLRAGVKLQIRGLGTRFSQAVGHPPFSYLVTSTTHTIGDGGYTTDFTARMESSLGK